MDQPSPIVDVAEPDFEREVLQRSTEVPVVVDFWAPWCGPCKALGPILERLADEEAGAFVLAKVNIDEAPALAQDLGIGSIPAVMAFREGALVAEFVGAQPERAVREFLTRVLPTQADELALEAAQHSDRGEDKEAESSFRSALSLEARHPRALVGLARILAARGEGTQAMELLEHVPPGTPFADQADRLAAELRTRSEGGADEATLRTRLEADPEDLESALALGRTLAAEGRYEEGLEQLLAVVQRDPHFDDEGARKAMLDIFSVIGPEDPLTQSYRTKLARCLFR